MLCLIYAMCLVNFELYILGLVTKYLKRLFVRLSFTLAQTDVTDVSMLVTLKVKATMPAELSGYILYYIIIY